ncbi:DUF4339 domain-containing protein [Neorhizobium sp. JUb45]|uniref:DUF4339 domain-containing protein n=1 Tax=Neorhizobium sp. JUb45 TaxID=2485113 RepID=UPI00104F0E1D|nr:DUF4339 domain-containing protein [Neorhizobium sp. JUb45]TCR07218.1 uncharacterized protein DUF4339 [Neorhizobium sp. JUb45]
MTDWHYSDNGGRFGPVSRDELISKFKSGAINSDTLVWTGSLGSTWRRFAEVDDLRDDGSPPPLPISEINSFWIWTLATVPAIGWAIEAVLTQSYGGVTTPAIFLAYAAANGVLAALDEKAVRASGRRKEATPFFGALLLAPLYIFIRNRRLRMKQYTMLAWVASVVFSIFASAGFTRPYLGLATPTCDSSLSVAQVKAIFPDIPLNLLKVGVKDVTNISTVSQSGKLTTCSASVLTNANATVGITYTIEERESDYYYLVSLE